MRAGENVNSRPSDVRCARKGCTRFVTVIALANEKPAFCSRDCAGHPAPAKTTNGYIEDDAPTADDLEGATS